CSATGSSKTAVRRNRDVLADRVPPTIDRGILLGLAWAASSLHARSFPLGSPDLDRSSRSGCRACSTQARQCRKQCLPCVYVPGQDQAPWGQKSSAILSLPDRRYRSPCTSDSSPASGHLRAC